MADSVWQDNFVEQVNSLSKKAASFPPDKHLLLVKACRRYLLGQPDVKLCQRICSSKEGSAAFSLVLLLFSNFLRTPKQKQSEKVFTQAMKSFKMPPSLSDLILQAIMDVSAIKIEQQLQQRVPQRLHLQQLQWDINVEICSNVIGRVLEPVIVLRIQLSSGALLEFEVTLEAFHQLRFSVADLLKQMNDLENRQIMKMA